ncbi:Cu/Pi carrier [Rhodotorula toruloides]
MVAQLMGSLFQGSFTTPALPAFSLGGVAASVVDDAKSKAEDLKNKASHAASSVGDKVDGARAAASTGAAQAVSKAAPGTIELYSGKYYATCALGGALACGTTHAFVTPLDLVKCRKQVDKNIYKSNMDGWKKIHATEGGIRGLYTGVGPTLIGYSMQGAAKYGFYEYFKKFYSDLAGAENAVKYKDAIYLAGSASAEFFADMALVPMETVKVRMQTTFPPFATSAVSGLNKVVAAEGSGALFKSLPSLWGRQIPYTMMKFWSFEATVAAIYNALGAPKESYNKLQQLGVSATAGYIAGVFCAVVSHPADTMVSKLNAPLQPGQAKPTVGSIYQQIGFGGLWGGLGTRIIMIGTLTALQWLIYDTHVEPLWTFKVTMGLPTTGSAAPDPTRK